MSIIGAYEHKKSSPHSHFPSYNSFCKLEADSVGYIVHLAILLLNFIPALLNICIKNYVNKFLNIISLKIFSVKKAHPP